MENAKRLFIALSLNSELDPGFLEMLRKIKATAGKKSLDVTWVRPENFHITLKFLGSVDESRLPTIIEALECIGANVPPLKVEFSGVGAFPDVFAARVIWVAVKNTRALRALQQDIEAEMVLLGHVERDEEFFPHVTIGRLRNKTAVKDVISPFVRKHYGRLAVDRITLFESRLHGRHPIYAKIRDITLAGEAPPDLEPF